jgi:biopolymer transport protein ExbB
MSDAVSHFIVKGTLILLVAFSIITWAVVVVKGLSVWRARRQDARLLRGLGESANLPSADTLRKHVGPTARVAQVGIAAWTDASDAVNGDGIEVPRDLLERSLRRQIQKERRTTESGLAVLASIGTTSPFVGLFGTVWGIMHALKSISSSGSASLDVVAGPIGEALVATGIGIAVAVPAVLAYNYFVRRLKLQAADLDDFANALVSAALRATLDRDRPEKVSGERSVAKLSEARGSTPLREARV